MTKRERELAKSGQTGAYRDIAPESIRVAVQCGAALQHLLHTGLVDHACLQQHPPLQTTMLQLSIHQPSKHGAGACTCGFLHSVVGFL